MLVEVGDAMSSDNQNQLQALNNLFEEIVETLQPTIEFMHSQLESMVEAMIPALHALQAAHDARMVAIERERTKRALWLARKLRAGRTKRKAAYRMHRYG